MNKPRYPHITVPLVGEDGNAMAVAGRVHRALRSAGVPPEARDEFLAQALRGSYDQLLQTVMEWVQVE